MLPKGLMNMVIGFMLTMVLITTKADPRVKRYQVAKGESGRYIGRTNPGDPFICHYYGVQYEVSDHCESKNKNGTVVEGKRFNSWFYPGTGSYPACPALPEIMHGYWMCPINVWYKSVEVYAVCAAKCLQGYHMEGDVVVRCPESLMWNNFTTPQCSSDHHPPERPKHVHVQVLNTSAVNVSWASLKNDTSVIGYTVHITCNDDYSLTLNSTKDSLIIPKLDMLKNYTITVIAFSKYRVSLQSDPVYVELSDSCQLYNISFITNIPREVIVYWNATTECQDWNLTFVMSNELGQSNKKYLKKNTSFLVMKQIDLDTDYSVYIFIEEEELISGMFTSAAVDPPYRPEHVHVQVLNTSAVNVSWASPLNDTSIIGYTVHITCNDDYSLTLNSTKDSLIIPKLEILKNYTITVIAFSKYRVSLQSDPVYVELSGKKRKEDEKDEETGIDNQLVLMILLGVVVLIFIMAIICLITCVLCKRSKRKCQRKGGDVASEESLNMVNMDNNKVGVAMADPVNGPSVPDRSRQEESDSLLLSNPPAGSIDSHETRFPPSHLDIQSLNSSEGSLELTDAPDHNYQSFCQFGESSSMENISQCDSSNADLEEINKVQPVNRSRSGHQKRVPRSDSGRGSVTGSSSTTSDPADIKQSSSQGSDKSHRGPSYNHQISADSGRDSETETGTEHINNYRSQTGSAQREKATKVCDGVKEDTAYHQSVGVEKHVLEAQPCLTNISERSNEEESSVKCNQEECFCTIAAFIDSPNSYQHLADLGDLLDPDDHYGQQRSWKGFVKDVLQLEHYKIIAMASRQKGNSPFQTEVLDHMKAKGTKIGHLVSYFSRSEHFRPDVLKAIIKFHLGCKFCDTILAQHKLCDVKES